MVKTLNREQFLRARHAVKTLARPLDRALFEHRFDDAPITRVIDRLASYQNKDGGFGHALEPDVRTPSSSALATGIGLHRLKELGCPARHPMVTLAVGYLRDTFDTEKRVWRAIPQDANEYPHAPWWHDEDGSLEQTFDQFLIMPRARLVGLLHHYEELVPEDWLEVVTEEIVADISTLPEEVFSGGGDALRYALELIETAALPQRFRVQLLPRLRDLADRLVCRDQSEWSTYCAAPLKIAPFPDSVVADELHSDLQQHLDYTIDHQDPAGGWWPTWTWGGSYPEAWAQARQEWCGEITLSTLTSLLRFGRIDV